MGRARDRTAEIHGCLLVSRRAPNAIHGGREYAQWTCLCANCGGRPTYKQEHFTHIEAGRKPAPSRCKLCPTKRQEARRIRTRAKKRIRDEQTRI